MNDVASPDASIHGTVLEASADALGLALLVCDRNDEIVYASRAILQFYPIPSQMLRPGTRLRDYIGALFDSGVPAGSGAERGMKRGNRDEWISAQLSLHWRERVDTIDRVGRDRWFSLRRRRLTSGFGILEVSDISEQKKHEEQTALDVGRMQLMEEILDSLPNPVCIKDRNLTYIAVNKAFCTMHGMAADSILGRSAWDLLEPDLAERFEQSDRQTLDTGIIHRVPEQIVTAEGEDLWVVTRKYRVGEPSSYVVVTCMNDVTDLVIGYETSPADDAPAALRVRNCDIFQPAQNCYDPFRSMDVHQLADASAMIEPQALVKARILVLTAQSLVERTHVAQLRHLGFDACAVHDLGELAAFRTAAEAAGLTIDALLVDGDDDLLREIETDWFPVPALPLPTTASAQDLQAVLAGALSHGEAEPRAPRVADQADWHIVVCDTVDGLHIPEIEVLVAEDNRINQFVFIQILEGLGLSHRLATNGQEAVNLWQQHRPNLVLMDVSMPVMNGFDAARAIRAAEGDGPFRTPIIAVMAQAHEIDLENSRAAGMDGHILKPISPDIIDAIYRKFVPGDHRAETAEQGRDAARGASSSTPQ